MRLSLLGRGRRRGGHPGWVFVESARRAVDHRDVGRRADRPRIAGAVPQRTRGARSAGPNDRTAAGRGSRHVEPGHADLLVPGPRPGRLASTGALPASASHSCSRRDSVPSERNPSTTDDTHRVSGLCLSSTMPNQHGRALDMVRPPSRCSRLDKTERLGGRVTAGNSPARTGGLSPGAASSQPPHMSISQSICRTTSFPVYERRYSRTKTATTDFCRFSAQRSQTIAASTSLVISPASGAGRNAFPSRVCTRAASVMLDTSQTPCAASRSAGRSAR